MQYGHIWCKSWLGRRSLVKTFEGVSDRKEDIERDILEINDLLQSDVPTTFSDNIEELGKDES